jgi:hypothetical protein
MNIQAPLEACEDNIRRVARHQPGNQKIQRDSHKSRNQIKARAAQEKTHDLALGKDRTLKKGPEEFPPTPKAGF